MFIAQSIKPNNPFWKYLLGSFTIIVATLVGQLPILGAIILKKLSQNESLESALHGSSTTLMNTFDRNFTLFLLLSSFVFSMVAILLVVKYFHKQTILSVTTARKKVDYNRIMFSFTIWAVFGVLSTCLDYYNAPENYVYNFKLIPFLILLVVATIMIPIQTSVEEYVFRGYLMQGFAVLSKNKWIPLLMTSIIFGSLHLANPEVIKLGPILMVYYIGTGLFLGILTLMDDGMELNLGFHAANNLVGTLLVTSDWSVIQSDSILKNTAQPSAGYEVILPVFLIFPILLYIFSKKYNWTDWKNKLTGNIEINNQIKDKNNG
jgi:membrane protease YdiL (CAAX protease family)